MKLLIRNFTLGFLVALCSGCTALMIVGGSDLVKPKFTYIKYKKGDIDKEKATVYLYFEASNPNRIGLKDTLVDYELSIEGQRFLTGQQVSLNLVPGAKTEIIVPADVVYKDVFKAAGPVIQLALMGREKIPVDVRVRIHGEPKVYDGAREGSFYAFNFETSQRIEVDIPKAKLREFKRDAKLKYKAIRALF